MDYTNPVDDVRGELVSRGYDIPWTTCTHGTQGCCPRDSHPVDNIPWINSLLLMSDERSVNSNGVHDLDLIGTKIRKSFSIGWFDGEVIKIEMPWGLLETAFHKGGGVAEDQVQEAVVYQWKERLRSFIRSPIDKYTGEMAII